MARVEVLAVVDNNCAKNVLWAGRFVRHVRRQIELFWKIHVAGDLLLSGRMTEARVKKRGGRYKETCILRVSNGQRDTLATPEL